MAGALIEADAVRARIARARLGCGEREVRVGRFTLYAAQRETLAAISRAVACHGGALLADPPGTGKTVIALAFAGELRVKPLVVAPAALAEQWRRAADDAETPITFVSMEALGRGASPSRAALVIVDEAHHARTPTTRRYARLAQLCVGARVLLLSATPVVNRVADRDALLALFLGDRAPHLDAQTLAEVVVRRHGDPGARPPVRRIDPLGASSDVPGLAEAIATLPPPLPAADGLAATSLVRITLAMAWRSSLAALDATLHRREQRGLVLSDALASGRWPDRAQLRHWILGDDATQLALPLVLDRATAAPASLALDSMRTHLDAIRALRRLIAPHIGTDSEARSRSIWALCRAHPNARVVCFAQHAATIRALRRGLRQEPGVVAITGERVHAAAGRWTRGDVLSALGPDSQPFRADDPRGIRLLLATDLLAEGVELQGVSIVVHGDAAWTPARMEQRVGRAARAGSSAREVIVTRFESPRGARELLRLAARLAGKRRARTRALRDAAAEECVARLLACWAGPRTAERSEIFAVVEGSAPGFLALVHQTHAHRESLVAGLGVGGRWRVSADPRAIARRIKDAGGPPCAPEEAHLALERSARAALSRWAMREAAVEQLGGSTGADTRLWQRLSQRVGRSLARSALAARSKNATEWSAALRTLFAVPGVGARRRLEALDRAAEDDRVFVDALMALAAEWRSAPSAPTNGGGAGSTLDGPLIRALLLIVPTRHAPRADPSPAEARRPSAPRAASTGSAATR